MTDTLLTIGLGLAQALDGLASLRTAAIPVQFHCAAACPSWSAASWSPDVRRHRSRGRYNPRRLRSGGEFAAVVELRRLFPGIADNAHPRGLGWFIRSYRLR